MASEMVRYLDHETESESGSEPSVTTEAVKFSGTSTGSVFQILRQSSVFDQVTLQTISRAEAGIDIVICDNEESFFASLDADDDD